MAETEIRGFDSALNVNGDRVEVGDEDGDDEKDNVEVSAIQQETGDIDPGRRGDAHGGSSD